MTKAEHRSFHKMKWYAEASKEGQACQHVASFYAWLSISGLARKPIIGTDA